MRRRRFLLAAIRAGGCHEAETGEISLRWPALRVGGVKKNLIYLRNELAL